MFAQLSAELDKLPVRALLTQQLDVQHQGLARQKLEIVLQFAQFHVVLMTCGALA